MSTFDAPESVRLGKCKLIEEVMIGEDKLIKFSGTFVLRGPPQFYRFIASEFLKFKVNYSQSMMKTSTYYGIG